MFKSKRQQKDEVQPCILVAKTILKHGSPTPRADLVKQLEKELGRERTELVIDQMVDSGLLLQREQFFERGMWDFFHGEEPALILPASELAFA